MTDIVEKLKKAQKGDSVTDPSTGINYQVLEASEKGGMPLTIARGGNWCTA